MNLDLDNMDAEEQHELRHTEKFCLERVYMLMSILMSQHNMPLMFVFMGKKGMDCHGSQGLKTKFQQAFDDDPSWYEAMVADSREMSHSQEDEDQQMNRQDPRLEYQRVIAGRPIKRLPYKLHLMNLEELNQYLMDLVKK